MTKEELFEKAQNGLEVEFVARKKPRGITIKTLKNGKTKVIFELLQDDLNNLVKQAAEQHKKGNNKN